LFYDCSWLKMVETILYKNEKCSISVQW
jgi:hypothetical protein